MAVVAFTGYRPEKMPFSIEANNAEYLHLRRQLRRVVKRLLDLGCDRFISGMARGFDLWAAEEVLRCKAAGAAVLLECAIPFPDQSKGYSAAEKELYAEVLRGADAFKVHSDSYHREAYFVRNRYMVEQADVVVACFDGRKGGTFYTVRYAEGLGKGLILIHPKTGAVTAQRVSLLDDAENEK